MKLRKLLTESLEELKNKPSLFIPKLIVSLIGSLWMLGTLYLTGNPLDTTNTPNIEGLMISLALFPVIFFLGILSPVIVAEMVKNNIGLIKATKKTLKYTPKIMKVGLMLIAAITLAVVPAYLGILATLATGQLLWSIIGSIIALGILTTVTFGLYFLPITLTEDSATESLKESFKASKNSKKEVTVLIIFSFSLLFIAGASSDIITSLGIAGFVIGRLLSSAVTTYTVIISPKKYMEIEEELNEN